jgi:protein-L-isoaspartate(D-aspartate) O-methyltransferase
MDTLSSYRTFFANLITANAGVRSSNQSLVKAFAVTPREKFLGPGPWKVFTLQGYIETPSDDPSLLYQDITVALKEADRINNGQPSLHARCLDALQINPAQTVVHIGTGTGYYTAILAELVGHSGHVYGFEIDNELAARTTENMREYPAVTLYNRSGASGELPDCDVIYVNAGATGPLDIWLDALRIGGQLLFPLTTAANAGGMLLLTKAGENNFGARFIGPAMFIPCIGARDDQAAARLADAFRHGDFRQVRSLQRKTQPDETCWCRGDNWWLSTAATL